MDSNYNQSKDGNQNQRDTIDIQALANLKQRLRSSNIPEKVALLFDALKYGQQGLDLIIQQALEDDSEQIKQAAYWVLQGHDPYLAYADHPNPTEFAFPTDTISSLAIASDRDMIAGGSWKIIRIWDFITGTLIYKIEAHSSWILSLEISLQEQIIASGSADTTIKIWNLENGQLRHNLSGHSSWVNALAITPDGKKLISASADYTLKLWEIKSGKLIHTFEGHSGSVTSIAIALNGNILISGSADQTIKLWDLNKKTLLQTLDGHSDWVQAIAVNSKSDKIISGSRDGEIRVWKLETIENQPTPKKGLSNLGLLGKVLSPILPKSRDNITQFIQSQWTCLKTYDLNQSPINCLVLESSDTRLFIVGENARDPILYYTSILQQFFGHDFEPKVYHLRDGVAAFGLDQNHLVMGNYNWISIFNLNTGEMTQTIEGCSRPSLKSLEIYPSNQEIEFGQCIQLQVQGFYGESPSPVPMLKGVIWQILQGNGSIDSDGNFYAGDIQETVTITAAFKHLIATKSIEVLEPPKLHSLKISPENVEIKPDGRGPFIVRSWNQHGRHIDIDSQEWTVSGGGKMEGSTFIPENNAKGSFTVTVKAVAKGITKSTQANITVIPVLRRIAIQPEKKFLEPNQTQKFQVIGLDQKDEEMKIDQVKWEATGGIIDAQENFVAGNDEKGNFQITAIVGTHHTQANVEIIPVLRKLTISPLEVELETEQSCNFQVTGLDQHQDEIQIPEVHWQISESESDTHDAIVDEKTGYFTAGKNHGHFKVTATVRQTKAEALVVVKQLTSLVILPQEAEIIEIEFGQWIDLTVQGCYQSVDQSSSQRIPLSEVTWNISEPTPCYSRIETSGKFYAGYAQENVTITATVKDITATKSVKVLEPAKLHSLVIAPETGEIKPDERRTFTVQGKDQYDRHIDIDSQEWTVNGGGKMEGSTFIADHDAKGSFTVTVKAVAKGITKSTQANITVIPVLRRIEIQTDQKLLEPNQSQKFQVIGLDQKNEEIKIDDVKWEATGGRIDDQGNFVAGNNEKGNFQITAIVGTHQTKADVEIIPVLRELTISPLKVELETEQSCNFQVTGLDQHQDEIQIPEIHWQISEPESDTHDAIVDEKTGHFTAGQNAGNFMVTATVGDKKVNGLIIVKKLTRLKIYPQYPEIIEIEFGQWIDFTVQGYYQSVDQPVDQSSSQRIPLSEVTWNISEPTPCYSRIEPNGKFYAGYAQENVTITATVKDITASRVLKVLEPAKLTFLDLWPTNAKINPDQQQEFTVEGYDQRSRYIPIGYVEWTVNDGGRMEGSTFIPDHDAKGSFTVTATEIETDISTSVQIIIIPVLKRIQIHPAQISLEPNQSQKFQVMGFDQTDEEIKIDRVKWLPTGGIIDAQGNFVAGNDEKGNFQITAIVGTHHTQANVEIIPVLRELTIRLSGGDAEFYENNLEIEFGKCADFMVQGFDQVGSPIDQLPPVTWTLQTQTQYSRILDDNGKFYAGHVEETVTIIATVKDITASRVLKVLEPAKLTFLDLWPTNAKINPDQQQEFTVEGYDQRFRPIDIGSVEWTVSGGGKMEGSTFVPDKNAKGTFTITVKSIETDISESTDITVVQVLRRIEIKPNQISLEPKESYQFEVLSFDQKDEPISDDTFSKSIQWECTHGGKINRKGLFIGNYKNNQVNVTATTDFLGSSCSAQATVTLLPVVRRLQIETDGKPIELEQGESYTFKAIAFDQYENQIDPATIKITWEATGGEIDENGKFTADRNVLGNFLVTATTTKETKSQQRLRIVALGIYLKFLDWLLSLSFVEDFLYENFDNFADNQGLTSDSTWINILIDGVEQWVFKTILNLIRRILNWFIQICLAQGIERISDWVEVTIVRKSLENVRIINYKWDIEDILYLIEEIDNKNSEKYMMFHYIFNINYSDYISDSEYNEQINYNDYISYIEYNRDHIDYDNWIDDYE
jgi:molybdenum cofactor biosynthesis enzyme